MQGVGAQRKIQVSRQPGSNELKEVVQCVIIMLSFCLHAIILMILGAVSSHLPISILSKQEY